MKIIINIIKSTLLISVMYILLVLFPGQVNADTFTVNTNQDTYDQVCDSDCSIRDAINEVNNSRDKKHTIVLPAGKITLTRAGSTAVEKDVSIGDIDITTSSEVTIIGQGMGNTIIDANKQSSIFDIQKTPVTFKDMTLKNGLAKEFNALPYDCDDYCEGVPITSGGAIRVNIADINIINCAILSSSAFEGGAIESDFGDITIKNSTFTDNSAEFGGVVVPGNYDGDKYADDTLDLKIFSSTFNKNHAIKDGGIVSDSSVNVDIVIKNSMFIENSAGRDGGVIEYSSGDHMKGWGHYAMQIKNSTFRDNSAASEGGAIAYHSRRFRNYHSERILIKNSRFSENSAARGGAVYHGVWYETYTTAEGTLAYIRNSSFTNNIATEYGGAIYSTNAAKTKIYNTTLSGNRAKYGGAAIFGSHANRLYLLHSTVADNHSLNEGQSALAIYLDSSAQFINIKNSIITDSDKTLANSAKHFCYTSGGKIRSYGHNVIDSLKGCTDIIKKKTDVFTDPLLQDIRSTDGKPDFYTLHKDSPAKNLIPSQSCFGWNKKLLKKDQRRGKRPKKSRCDAGSVEM